DPRRLGPRSGLRVALDLVRDLDEAAGVDDVVGGVEDPALLELLLDARVRQLVVGRTADDLRLQDAHDVVGQRTAQSARRVDVHGLGLDVVDPHDVDLRVEHPHTVDRVAVDVGHHHRGAVLEQMLDEVVTDLADAGDAHATAGQRGSTPGRLRCGAHPLEDAV